MTIIVIPIMQIHNAISPLKSFGLLKKHYILSWKFTTVYFLALQSVNIIIVKQT